MAAVDLVVSSTAAVVMDEPPVAEVIVTWQVVVEQVTAAVVPLAVYDVVVQVWAVQVADMASPAKQQFGFLVRILIHKQFLNYDIDRIASEKPLAQEASVLKTLRSDLLLTIFIRDGV